MRRVIDICPAGSWSTVDAVATVTLAFDDRYRRRIRLTDDIGNAFLLDLTNPKRFSDGDGLVLEEGGILAVRAAPETVIDITCDTIEEKARIAWHLGNRHTPVQVLPEGELRIRQDHVLEQMAQSLGATTQQRTAPFEPEGGAYEHGHVNRRGGQHHDH